MIQIIMQDDEPDGRPCSACQELIQGKRYVMMVQVGGPENAVPMDYQLCEKCYADWENKK